MGRINLLGRQGTNSFKWVLIGLCEITVLIIEASLPTLTSRKNKNRYRILERPNGIKQQQEQQQKQQQQQQQHNNNNDDGGGGGNNNNKPKQNQQIDFILSSQRGSVEDCSSADQSVNIGSDHNYHGQSKLGKGVNKQELGKAQNY